MAADPKESKLGSRDGCAWLTRNARSTLTHRRPYPWLEGFECALDHTSQLLGETQVFNVEQRDYSDMPQLSGPAEGKPGGRMTLRGLSKDSIRELRNKGEVSCAECRR